MGIIFALASMVFAGFNDFVFKQYIHKAQQPLGHFVTGIGLIWALVFGAAMFVTEGGFSLAYWPISLGAGLASVVANLLLINSLRFIPAGTGATIYRLNLIVAAIMGVVLLHESVTAWKITGIALGVASVLLLKNGNRQARSDQFQTLAMISLVAACLLRATMGILYKMASTYDIPKFEVLTVSGICWVIGGVTFSLLRREPARCGLRTCRYSILSGLLVCGIVYFLLLAMNFADASIVVPVAQLSFVLTCVLGILFHSEHFDLRKGIALVAAMLCIIAMSCG